jgi:hypothetical protein
MFRRKILIAGLLPLLALPLMGDSCTEDKVIFIAVGLDTTAGFIASGELNIHDDTKTIDVKEDMDLETVLDDNDIDPEDIESVKVSRVYYRVTVPEAGRSIENGNVEILRNGVTSSVPLITGFSGDGSAGTDWIEITNLLQPQAVNLLNDFMQELLNELQGGAPVSNTLFTYHVTGNSIPADVPTNFQWELKVSFNVQAEQEVEVPNF